MKIQLRILSILAVFSFLFYSCEKDADGITDIETRVDTTETVGAEQAIPGEYIVIYKEDKSLSGKSTGMKAKSQQTLSKYAIAEDNIKQTYSSAIQGFHVKNLSKKQVEMLKKDLEIAYIQPNYIVKLDVEMGKPVSQLPATVLSKGVTNDSWLPSGDFLPWGVNRVGRASGSGKVCWIIDSGIAPHPDLKIDASKSRSFVGGSWQDQNGHGTHVAGTVAAKNNGSGVIGVAYGATVVSVRVLGAGGTGSVASILAGVDYVAKSAWIGDIWNYSIGSRYRHTNVAIDNAFRKLQGGGWTGGAMAAGNSNDDTQFYSPQRLLLQTANSFIWCVGNMTNSDGPAESSNYGNSVSAWAPGTNVWSTWLNGGFNKMSGTSMASPHVAGILLIDSGMGTDGFVSKGGHTAPIATTVN
ncbi:S8 family serine peptidase [Aquimarina sp. I32.4]|uniref:S8 family peptidase n=1 Tax=Aquimarina sp. I32.4 TaxID=2053903 RepID=UPI00130497B8|nr:S8 family serine peptidase [Aquimarina sp. I32.4]